MVIGTHLSTSGSPGHAGAGWTHPAAVVTLVAVADDRASRRSAYDAIDKAQGGQPIGIADLRRNEIDGDQHHQRRQGRITRLEQQLQLVQALSHRAYSDPNSPAEGMAYLQEATLLADRLGYEKTALD